MTKTLQEKYKERVSEQKKRLKCSDEELFALLKDNLKQNRPSLKVTEFKLKAWSAWPATVEKPLPPVDVLPCIADVLETNIGYLFEMHDVHEMRNPRLDTDIDVVRCNEYYQSAHDGKTLWNNSVMRNQTYHSIRRKDDVNFRIQPIIKLSEAIGWDIDYILGLTDIRHWQYWCVENRKFDYIPDGTRFLLSDMQTIVTINNGTFDVIKDGIPLKMDQEYFLKQDPKIICGYKLLD